MPSGPPWTVRWSGRLGICALLTAAACDVPRTPVPAVASPGLTEVSVAAHSVQARLPTDPLEDLAESDEAECAWVPNPGPLGPRRSWIDTAYHDYDAMLARVDDLAASAAARVWVFDPGLSHEGRRLRFAKISDHVEVDEAEPEILITAHLHAREHLTTEQALYVLEMLVEGYETDERIRRIVDGREIFIAFNLNPDGAEADRSAGGVFLRKNRQPGPLRCPWRSTGVDLNRNFGGPGERTEFDLHSCADVYEGPRPLSAPETRTVAQFVESRVRDGRQQLRLVLDLHAFSEKILWPYGYTKDDVPPDMDAADRQTMMALAQGAAELNGYEAVQSSDVYVHRGTFVDWVYREHRIYALLMELYPGGWDDMKRKRGRVKPRSFYPELADVRPQVTRNREALLYLLELAGCPEAAGHSTTCPPARKG